MQCRTLTVVVLCLASPAAAADAPISFRERVAPILVRSCLGCHDAKKAANGLNMTTFALLKKGGKSAGTDILEPGDPDASALIESVRPDASPRMPYKQPPLSDGDIRTLETWVKQGARFDAPSETETPIASLVDPLRDLPRVPLTAPASDPVTSLAFSPDGSTLAAAVGNRLLSIDAATGKVRLPEGSKLPGPINSVRYAPDGKTLVAAGGRGGMFGFVSRVDLKTNERQEARGHSDAILAAEISPDGKALATAGYDRQVILWDLARLVPVRALKEHTDAVHSVAFSPDGKSLASAGADRTVKLWDVATGRRTKTLADATAELYAVAFAPDGSTVFAAGVDRSIRAWKVADKDSPLVKTAFAHDAAVLRLVASADGKTLVSSGEDRTVKLWDLATLSPRAAVPEKQSDWPQALALSGDGKRLAVGRYDGTVVIVDAATGATALTFSTAPATPAVPPAKPELIRNATLNPPSPRGATRGTTTRLTLTGEGVGRATEVVLDEPGLVAVSAGKTTAPNQLDVDLTVAADARVGLHRVGVVTPLGVPSPVSFAVEAHAAASESEPNDLADAVKPVSLPATLSGTVEKPGDVDHFRFASRKGQQLVFVPTARALGSKLWAVLTLLDDRGHTVAEAATEEGDRDPTLTALIPADGTYSLRVADADYGGSGEHFYRIAAGESPYPTGVFPLGVAAGRTTGVGVSGLNLKGLGTDAVTPPAGTEPGTILDVPVVLADGSRPGAGLKVVVCEGPQSTESEPNDEPAKSEAVSAPGGVSARIGREGDVDHFRFPAKKGVRLILEVFGRRLGTRIDPLIEILDAQGRVVPRAMLRPVAETELAFRDHNSTVTGIRLTRWDNLAIGDTVLFGREVGRVLALPRNPDDDCQFWGEQSLRVGFLETTPEHHPMGQPIYKVEVHPPGATFPPGGVAPVRLDYRNDDGGPSFNKDSRLTFDPPVDGDYVVRVADVRAMGGESFGYHLVVRRPRPDFRFAVSPESPNVPRGGTALVTVTLTRVDGFDGAVDVTAEHLPPGISVTPVTIEPGATTAVLALSAEPTAPAFSPPTWRVIARGRADSSSPAEVRHDIDPGGPRGGRVTVTPGANLKVVARPSRVSIRPGQEVTLTLAVERGPAFKGRVPIDVRNLPHGVRVLNIGLNGVLVTEAQTERTVTLYAEPWVGPMERPFYAVGRAEAAATDHSSPPVTLAVEPATGGTAVPATASARPE